MEHTPALPIELSDFPVELLQHILAQMSYDTLRQVMRVNRFFLAITREIAHQRNPGKFSTLSPNWSLTRHIDGLDYAPYQTPKEMITKYFSQHHWVATASQAWFLAALQGVDALQNYCAKHPNVNWHDMIDQGPGQGSLMHWAVFLRDVQLVLFLLRTMGIGPQDFRGNYPPLLGFALSLYQTAERTELSAALSSQDELSANQMYEGKRPLFYVRDVTELERLLSAGADPSLRDADGLHLLEAWSCRDLAFKPEELLHHASLRTLKCAQDFLLKVWRWVDEKTLARLVQAGVRKNVCDAEGNTAAHLAANQGEWKQLLALADATLVRQANTQGQMVLDLLLDAKIKEGFYEVSREVGQYQEYYHRWVHQATTYSTHTEANAYEIQTNLLRQLCDLGAQCQSNALLKALGNSRFLLQPDWIVWLIEAGASLEATNERGQTAIELLIQHYYHRLPASLLERYSQWQNAAGQTILDCWIDSIGQRRNTFDQNVLEQYHRFNITCHPHSVLTLAAHTDLAWEAIQLLCDMGADWDARDEQGNHAVHKAAARGSVECMLQMMEHDHQCINLANNNQRTALDLCTSNTWDDLWKTEKWRQRLCALPQMQCRVDWLVDRISQSYKFLPALRDKKAVHFLTQAGARLDTSDAQGNTAAYWAVKKYPEQAFLVFSVLWDQQPNYRNQDGQTLLDVWVDALIASRRTAQAATYNTALNACKKASIACQPNTLFKIAACDFLNFTTVQLQIFMMLGAELHWRDEQGHYVVHEAARNGNLAFLLNCLTLDGGCINFKNHQQHTPLDLLTGHAVEKLWADVKQRQQFFTLNPLCQADWFLRALAKEQYYKKLSKAAPKALIDRLIKAGAQLDFIDENTGNTAAHLAIQSAPQLAFLMLHTHMNLKNRQDKTVFDVWIDAVCQKQTPFDLALLNQFISKKMTCSKLTIIKLLTSRVELKIKTEKQLRDKWLESRVPLKIKTVKQLCDLGASLQSADEQGNCAVHHAAMRHDEALMLQMMEYQPMYCNLKNHAGNTPLDIVAETGGWSRVWASLKPRLGQLPALQCKEDWFVRAMRIGHHFKVHEISFLENAGAVYGRQSVGSETGDLNSPTTDHAAVEPQENPRTSIRFY